MNTVSGGAVSDAAYHSLKTDPAVFDAVWTGAKTFEIRLNDRGFKVGDVLNLRETTNPGADIAHGAPLVYTGRELDKRVSHVLTGYGLIDGWCCLSFETALTQQAVPVLASEPVRTERTMVVPKSIYNAFQGKEQKAWLHGYQTAFERYAAPQPEPVAAEQPAPTPKGETMGDYANRMRWGGAPLASEPEPFAYWVYIPAEQRGELVHTLDEAMDDLTNCECQVTNLYDHPAPEPVAAEQAREPIARLHVSIERHDMGQSLAPPPPPYKFARANALAIAETMPVGTYDLVLASESTPRTDHASKTLTETQREEVLDVLRNTDGFTGDVEEFLDAVLEALPQSTSQQESAQAAPACEDGKCSHCTGLGTLYGPDETEFVCLVCGGSGVVGPIASTPPPESAAPQGMASDAVARAIDAFADRERGRPQAFMAAKLVEEMRAILAANPKAQPDGGSKA